MRTSKCNDCKCADKKLQVEYFIQKLKESIQTKIRLFGICIYVLWEIKWVLLCSIILQYDILKKISFIYNIYVYRQLSNVNVFIAYTMALK